MTYHGAPALGGQTGKTPNFTSPTAGPVVGPPASPACSPISPAPAQGWAQSRCPINTQGGMTPSAEGTAQGKAQPAVRSGRSPCTFRTQPHLCLCLARPHRPDPPPSLAPGAMPTQGPGSR